MANINRPFGYRPLRHVTGAPFNGQVSLYTVPATEAATMAVGDLVDLAGTTDANGVRVVARAVAGGPAIGAIVGFSPDYTNLQNSGFKPTLTQRYVLVADSPDIIFEAQASGAYVAADSGLNANTTVTAATSNFGAGLSNMQVDMSTKAATSTLLLRILGPVLRPDVDLADGTNMKLEVMINNHRYSAGVTGI